MPDRALMWAVIKIETILLITLSALWGLSTLWVVHAQKVNRQAIEANSLKLDILIQALIDEEE